MANVARQIIGSFEDIGKDVVREVAKVPADIAGKALESLGAKSGPTGQTSVQPGVGDKGIEGVVSGGQQKNTNTPLDKIGQTSDVQVKQVIARAALSQLAGHPQTQKEPSVWEKLQQEDVQKQEAKKQQAKAGMSALPIMSAKPKRGNLYGMKAKKSPTEIGRNVRQD